MQFNSSSTCPGTTGLKNRLNHCYINSALQCLSNTPIFSKFYRSSIFLNHLTVPSNTPNNNSPSKTLTQYAPQYSKALCRILSDLWRPDCFYAADGYDPQQLINVLISRNTMFKDDQQHDSHQFLLFILGALQEETNRPSNKHLKLFHQISHAYQKQLAFESWKVYSSKYESPLNNLFYGQFKSKTTCPKCKYESTVFDTYNCISLPIPQPEPLQLFFIGYDRESLFYKVRIVNKYSTMDKVGLHMAKMLGANYDYRRLRFVILDPDRCTNRTIDISDRDVNSVIAELKPRNKSIFCVQLAPEEVNLCLQKKDINRINIRFTKSVLTQNQDLPPARPFFFLFSKVTVREIQKRLWGWLYRSVIKPMRPQDTDAEKAFNLCFLKPANAPFRCFLKMVNKKGDVTFYKDRGQLAANESLINILSSYNSMSYELEVNLDFIETAGCDWKQLRYYDNFDKICENPKSANSVSLNDCLDRFSCPEQLSEDNKWKCENCKEDRKAQKTISIYNVPKYLIIQLNRFKETFYHGTKIKINSEVDFPLVLDLKPYIGSTELPPITQFQGLPEIKCDTTQATFRLYSVINHKGTLKQGHYTTFTRNPENYKWYCFNDTYCHEVSQAQIQTKDAYILFYERL